MNMSSIVDKGQEKRQHQRYKADGLGIHSSMILASYLKIIDVSLGGMSFEADRRLNIGKTYSLKIKNRGALVTVKGVVVWCSLAKNIKNIKGDIIPVYKCGLEFTDVVHEDRTKIVDSVNSQRKKIDAEVENECVDLGSLFLQNNEKEELEEFVSSLFQ